MAEHDTTRKCTYCGGQIEYGDLVTSGVFAAGGTSGLNVQYRPSKRKGSRTYVGVGTCLHCGHIELYVDPKQLK